MGRAGSVALALALVTFLTYNQRHPILDVRYAKGHKLTGEIWSKWNSISRIGLERQDGRGMIFIDADASTGIADFDFDHLSPKTGRSCWRRVRPCRMPCVPARKR